MIQNENKSSPEDLSIFPQWRSFLASNNSIETQGFLRQVVKRNGSIEKFDSSKIENAIFKKYKSIYPNYSDVLNKVQDNINKKRKMEVKTL